MQDHKQVDCQIDASRDSIEATTLGITPHESDFCTPHPPSGGLLLVKSAQEIFNLTPKACILTAERVNVSMHIALSH